MATKRQPTPAGSVSWLALVAATTLGAARADTVHAEIEIDPQAVTAPGPFRLIVQSYPKAQVDPTMLPSESARPLGSVQRAVTQADLNRGIHVDLVEIADDIANAKENGGVVVAWVEPGEPTLEYDARRARPSPGSVWGLATVPPDAATVQLRLDRKLRNAG